MLSFSFAVDTQQHPVVVQGLAAGLAEFVGEIVNGELRAFFARHVVNHLALIHHQCAVAQIQGGLHVVGDHEAGDFIFLHDGAGQGQHLFGGAGVQGGGVLVQEE